MAAPRSVPAGPRRAADFLELGVVETHGRADTVALVAGLTLVPPRAFSYRGVTLPELDVDAVVQLFSLCL